jgi:hypothetical protein
MLEFRTKLYMLNDKNAYNLFRNVGRFYIAEESFRNDKHYSTYLFYLAQSCEMLGDFLGAECYLKQLKQTYPEWNSETVAIEYEHLEIRRKRKRVEVECEDKRLKTILENLVSVFFNIKKNIIAYVVENEDEYITLARTKLGYLEEENIPAYIGWVASGFYQRPGVHCLVFKKEFISDDDDKLTGLCAHELAHFELYDTGTVQKTLHSVEKSDIYLFREWTTDMHVIQRGFAYELFRDREDTSELETRILTAQEIEHFVQKIANYSEIL